MLSIKDQLCQWDFYFKFWINLSLQFFSQWFGPNMKCNTNVYSIWSYFIYGFWMWQTGSRFRSRISLGLGIISLDLCEYHYNVIHSVSVCQVLKHQSFETFQLFKWILLLKIFKSRNWYSSVLSNISFFFMFHSSK